MNESLARLTWNERALTWNDQETIEPINCVVLLYLVDRLIFLSYIGELSIDKICVAKSVVALTDNEGSD